MNDRPVDGQIRRTDRSIFSAEKMQDREVQAGVTDFSYTRFLTYYDVRSGDKDYYGRNIKARVVKSIFAILIS